MWASRNQAVPLDREYYIADENPQRHTLNRADERPSWSPLGLNDRLCDDLAKLTDAWCERSSEKSSNCIHYRHGDVFSFFILRHNRLVQIFTSY